jgi:hypothetical protein
MEISLSALQASVFANSDMYASSAVRRPKYARHLDDGMHSDDDLMHSDDDEDLVDELEELTKRRDSQRTRSPAVARVGANSLVLCCLAFWCFPRRLWSSSSSSVPLVCVCGTKDPHLVVSSSSSFSFFSD